MLSAMFVGRMPTVPLSRQSTFLVQFYPHGSDPMIHRIEKEQSESTRDLRPELVPDLVTRRKGDKVLFVHPSRPRWILINDSAAELAERFDGVRSLRELAEDVVQETGAPSELVLSDLENLVGALYKRGFLQSAEERAARGRPFSISGVFVRVTDACNLRCTQCYADSFGSLKSKKDELTTEEIHEVLREIRDLGGRTVTFSGGEPLLRPDMLDIAEFARNELGFSVKLNTNGTLLLPEGVVERLVPIVDELQISFDGSSAEIHDAVRGKGSFESSMRGAKKFIEAGGQDSLILCLTLMSSNIGSALEMPSLAKSVGARTVRYLNVVNDGRAVGTWAETFRPTDEQLIEFYDVLYFGELDTAGVRIMSGLQGFFPQIPEDFRNECFLCPVAMSPCVSPQGKVYPCSMFERPHFLMGSIRDEGGIRSVVESGRLQGVREDLGQRPKLISECSQCDWRGLCQSGCAGTVDMANGSTRHPDGFCQVRDHLYSRLIFEESGKGNDPVECSCVE